VSASTAAQPSLLSLYLDRLAQFEGRRYCSPVEAARYLDISRTTLDELLNSRQIKSQYQGHKLRKVLVASLLEYAETLPIDRPEPRRQR
jgi:hypothetical protein